jgi:hypothetical protein
LQVSHEISSQHRYKVLNMSDPDITRRTYHRTTRTNWKSYREDQWVVPRVIHLVQEVDLAANMVQQAILSFYHQNCPVKVALSPWTAPWWNTEFRCLKAVTRRLLSKLKEQVTKNHVISPSRINIQRSKGPTTLLEGLHLGDRG